MYIRLCRFFKRSPSIFFMDNLKTQVLHTITERTKMILKVILWKIRQKVCQKEKWSHSICTNDTDNPNCPLTS